MSSDGRKAPPPAPPLPPLRKSVQSSSSGELAAETPCVCPESSVSTPEDDILRRKEAPLAQEPYRPIYYFFYGTLTQPKVLSHILDLHEEPVLRPAKITGYELASWGQYPALVDGGTGQEVTGHAYPVQSTEDELKLARYETDAYEAVPCWIRFADGRDPASELGLTFKYAGDDESLKAGRFDRKLWELRMGTRLPDRWKVS